MINIIKDIFLYYQYSINVNINSKNILHFYASKQKLAQKVIVPEKGIGMIPIAVYSLNAKKVATETLYVIQVKNML